MANFYTDHPEIKFYLESSPLWCSIRTQKFGANYRNTS